jgi:hypothetical protein
MWTLSKDWRNYDANKETLLRPIFLNFTHIFFSTKLVLIKTYIFFRSNSLVDVALSTRFAHSNQPWGRKEANEDIYRWVCYIRSCHAMLCMWVFINWCLWEFKLFFVLFLSKFYILWGFKLCSCLVFDQKWNAHMIHIHVNVKAFMILFWYS